MTWQPDNLKLTHPYRDWELHSQSAELTWWQDHPPPSLQEAIEQSTALLDRWGFALDQFANANVIDVGCGPTGRLSAFSGGNFVAVDPLIRKYATIGAPLKRYRQWFECPAERRIVDLENWADAIFSINALDHGFDFCAAIINLRSCLRLGGLLFLSMGVDNPHAPDHAHPLRVTNEFVTRFLTVVGFSVDRISRGRSYLHPDGTWQDTYSGGPAYHWWAVETDA